MVGIAVPVRVATEGEAILAEVVATEAARVVVGNSAGFIDIPGSFEAIIN
jgi:hypothetical protein